MEAKNLFVIIGSNFRLIFKQTILPAVFLLMIIPLIYGTSNLDSIKSADCLGRMVTLIGLPMFTPLLRAEQREGIESLITLRTFHYRLIVAIRVCFSLASTLAFILTFEAYMGACGCIFPIYTYAFRTLVISTLLGFAGLLASAISRNTIVGYLVAFCLYCTQQAGILSDLLKPISSSISIQQIVFLLWCGLAIILFSKPALA